MYLHSVLRRLLDIQVTYVYVEVVLLYRLAVDPLCYLFVHALIRSRDLVVVSLYYRCARLPFCLPMAVCRRGWAVCVAPCDVDKLRERPTCRLRCLVVPQ